MCTNTLYDYAIIINIYGSLMHELKKNGKVFTSKFVGTGPSFYEKRIYQAAVSKFWGEKYSWMCRKTQTQMLAWGNYNMLQDFISPVIDK